MHSLSRVPISRRGKFTRFARNEDEIDELTERNNRVSII